MTELGRRIELGDAPGGDVETARRLASVLSSVPAAIALVRGRDHRFELVNPAYRALVGDRDVVGRTVLEALPEVEEQGFIALLDRVFETGEPHHGLETPVLLDRDGSGALQESFVNFVYLPMRDANGDVDGVLAHAVDVTELVQARRSVETLADDLAAERHRLETIIDQLPAGVVIADVPSGRLVAANREWREFFGVPFGAFGDIESYGEFSAHRADGTVYGPEEYPLARTVTTGETVVGEQLTIRRADGARRVIEVNSAPILRDGKRELAVATFFDVTQPRLTAALVEQNKELLELIAAGGPLEESLERIVRMIERNADVSVYASVLLVDPDGLHLRHGAAPSLPDAFNEAIDGIEIGPAGGSCGTAVHRRESVVVTDIATDPLWTDFRDLAAEHGLRACWSTPITGTNDEVVATFALYYTEPRTPTSEERSLVEIATKTAAVAIERKRLEEERERLLEAEQAARSNAEQNFRTVEALHRVGQAINASLDLQSVVQVVTDAATELTRAQFGAFFYNVIRSTGEAYTLYTLSGAPRSAFESFPMPRNTKIFDPTFRGTAIVRIDDVHVDPRFAQNPPYNGMPEGHLPVRSYLAVPVKNSDGDVLGGLFFGHGEPGVFTEESERLAVGIAAQAAVAIERGQLYVREHEARAEAERRAQAALSLEHVNDGVCLVDDEGVVRVWNPAAASITGIPSDEVVGRPFAEALPTLAPVAQGVAQAPSTSTVARPQTFSVQVGDRDLWLAISGIRFPDGVVYTFRDRSEERRVEQMRSDIIATVSHELRTPLAAVYGAARTIGRPELAGNTEVRERFIQMIVDETERLSRVVEEILLASELDALRAGIDLKPVAVEPLVRRVLDLAAVRADGVALELDAEATRPAAADEDKLQQVVSNLVDNALKYGKSGGRVVVRLREANDRVRLTVTDFGPGIPAHEAERIFDRFYRLDPDQRRGISGTGLGLHISREFVREMRGDVWHEPTPGGGATFVVDLAPAPDAS